MVFILKWHILKGYVYITNQIFVSKPKSLQKTSNNIEIYGINSFSAFKNGQSVLFSEKKVNEQDSLVYFHEQLW